MESSKIIDFTVRDEASQVKLATKIIRPSCYRNTHVSAKKIIIITPNFLEKISDKKIEKCRKICEKFKCEVLIFNYRDQPYSKFDLHADCLIQIKRLQKAGYLSKNIILTGKYIGGSVSAHVAAKCHMGELGKDFPINVFCDRAYDDINYVEPTAAKSNSSQTAAIMPYLPTFTTWYTASTAFNKIPPKFKAYTFMFNIDGTVESNSIDIGITHDNSIHAWGLYRDLFDRVVLESNNQYTPEQLFHKFISMKFTNI